MMRNDFPIFQKKINGYPLVYLDNAATTQKPQVVIDRLVHYYAFENANINRGVHTLSAEISQVYEAARIDVARFLNAASEKEIIFVRGTTEGINLVAEVFVEPILRSGDEILITHLEHHSNILPWQYLAHKKGAVLKVIPIFENGDLDQEAFLAMLNPRVKFLSLTHVASATGTRNPIEGMIQAAHQLGIPVLIDGAQAVARETIDLQKLGADFYVFSGHKLYAPTGIGVLYARWPHLKEAPPYQKGGGMIKTVAWEQTTYADVPERYEAGTPHIAGVVGLQAAIHYLNTIGMEQISVHEKILLKALGAMLSDMKGLRIIGEPNHRLGLYSFVLDGIHPHDAGTILDQRGIAVRVGHHCAMPLMNFYQIPGTIRVSLGLYNTLSDIEALEQGLHAIQKIWA